jgi:hypothetical protein
MWTPTTRRQHSRDHLRYETDLTDAEWALIEPLMPAPKPLGRPWAWPLREIMNAIFFSIRPVEVKALVGTWAVRVRLSLQALASLRNRPGGPSMMGSEGQGGTIYVSSFPLKS